MSRRRFGTIFRLELFRQIRHPLIWILILMLGLMLFGLSEGKVRIGTGDTTIGGKKAYITSEFANAQLLSVMVFMLYTFFVAVAAGMSVINDDELKVGELIHSTQLRPGEYIWGKYLAVTFLFFCVLGVHLGIAITFNHFFTDPSAVNYLGPFFVWNYLRPALIFSVPTLLFISGTTFAIGTLTRRPILVFALPIALLLGTGFFLWDWSPTWLNPSIDRFLMLLEPAGFRWLNETWLKVDRGVDFYNTASVPLEGLIIANRFGIALIGLGSVALARRRFTASLKGVRGAVAAKVPFPGRFFRRAGRPRAAAPTQTATVTSAPPLASLAMRQRTPGLVSAALDIARFELKGLLRQPGMYLFVPLILIQTIGGSLVSVGAFETPRLTTSGTYAAESVNTLSLLVCMLILFYTVESLLREQHTRLAPIFDATPAPTFSVLLGKSLANSAVGLLILLASFIGGVVVMLIQGKVSLEISPFLIVWGLLLIPTFLVWASFVTMVLAITRSRYTTYGIGLAAISYTGYKQLRGQMNWVGNWDLWNAVNWSDMSFAERDGLALLLNRLAVIGLALLFMIITVRIHQRREFDAARVLTRLSPLKLLRSSLGVVPFAVPPVVCLLALWFLVNAGSEGKAAEDRAKDYWRKNLATWKDAPLPSITDVNMKVDLEPERHWFHSRGTYRMANLYHDSIPQIPITGGDHWAKTSWTLNGAPVTPENRLRLYVFTPGQAMTRGDEIEIGFDVEGRLPSGITKNGGPAMEFILPGGVVITSFGPTFAPEMGFMEQVGVDDDNRYETKQYRDDFYVGVTEPAYGAATPYTTHIEITGPAEYVYNSVGTLIEDSVTDGKRTAVWQSDHPVNFFNIVAGRWDVRQGKDTIIYYHPTHTYNIDEMQLTLDAARHWYSEWFYPYPWRTLKLSEFPNHSTYAQGFPTNITFSEGIGFLTRSDQQARVASLVTAHESAHQWWGNILLPGRGPGGDILSEGMAHFSSIMLMGQLYGESGRIETCRRLEERYGENRQVDSERPLVKIDGSHAGDTTVTYDKGGWVFTMLQNLMGREANLRGLQSFIRHYDGSYDHPVLQDFTEHLRPFAPDAAAYDAFVQQWFHEVVVPEYRLSEVHRQKAAEGDGWTVSVKVVNAGTGVMPVEIAALSGERFLEQTPAEAAREAAKESGDYRHSGRIVTLGAGEETTVDVACDFEPDRVVVDPEARVLMLLRKNAVYKF